ncbi:MAG TPA: aspartate dehydrogenase [Hyphomicrobiaceae bacterium]|nr:aspartate dehydrogenase [Hyphomicrobiaceae bacterium]
MSRQPQGREPVRIGIAGLGAIGLKVARQLDEGCVEGVSLVAVASRDVDKARSAVASLTSVPRVVQLPELSSQADIIVDCTPASVFREVAGPVVGAGGTLLPLSVAALLDHMDLVEQARATGARIIVPTGAILGLDTVRAMAVGEIERVTLMTRKPPRGLAGAPHLVANHIDVSDLKEPLLVFKGTAREAARGFPANVNVAAALALAGIGPDRTEVEVWADPGIDRNIQSVTIISDSGEATMTMKNIPSDENPRTGRIVANSVIATLRRLTSPLIAGS